MLDYITLFSHAVANAAGRRSPTVAYDMEKETAALRDTQPPITNDQEYQGYRAGLALLNAECVLRAQTVIAHKDDPAQFQDALDALDRMNRKRQDIAVAIAAYEQRQQQSA